MGPPPSSSARLAPPPVSFKAKDYRMDRPFEVQNELDDLRNRGLAKVLNRHFTDTTKKLAKEKAAADAALADLERRRANTSEFVPSKGGDLSPFDAMYVELQQKRAECRRKERETLLLYQRYVHKFGKVAPKPMVMVRTPPSNYVTADGDVSPATSTPEGAAPPPPSPVPLRPKLEPLDENSETTTDGPVDPGINFSRFYNQHISSISSRTDPPTKSAEQDVPELEDLTEQPSHDEQSGVLSSTVMSASNDPPEHQVLLRREGDGLEAFLVRRDAGSQPPTPAKADPPTGSPTMTTGTTEQLDESTTPEIQIAAEDEASAEKSTDTPLVKELFRGATEETSKAALPVVGHSVQPIAEAASAKTAPPDRLEIGSEASDLHRPTREVTAAAPSSDSEEDADDRSVISGLTMSSQVTKQVMEEIEHEMTHFLNTETQAIRKLLDEEERTQESSAALNASVGDLGDETQAASLKAEALAKEMQRILDEYKGESSSGTVDAADEVTVATVGYPKTYATSDPTKSWMVYYDEKIRREYFYEKNSKVTQWEPPDSVESVTTIDPSVFAVDASPRPGFTRSVSRRDLYRKKMRKRRLRRLAAASMLTLLSASTVYHWQRNHSEKTYSDAMLHTWQSAARVFGDSVDATLYAVADTAESIKDTVEKLFSDPQKREIQEERNNKQAEEEERSQIEAERLEALRLQRHKEHEETGEAATSVEEERQVTINEEVLNSKEKDTTIQQAAFKQADLDSKSMQRPIGCFLPLASHIHPRCRKLARLKPMFKDVDILNSFMQ